VPSRNRLLIWAGLLAALAAVLVLGLAGASSSGRPAPALPAQRLSGPPVTLASLRGHPALITFWASWCGPCAREAPALERFAQGPVGRGRIVGVDWSDGLGSARSFARRYGWTFPTLRDPDGSVGYSYGVTDLPTTFLIDSRGRLRRALYGPQTEQSLGRALAGVG